MDITLYNDSNKIWDIWISFFSFLNMIPTLNEGIEIVIHRGRCCSVLWPCFACMQPGITNSRNMYTACLDIQLEVACSLFKAAILPPIFWKLKKQNENWQDKKKTVHQHWKKAMSHTERWARCSTLNSWAARLFSELHVSKKIPPKQLLQPTHWNKCNSYWVFESKLWSLRSIKDF